MDGSGSFIDYLDKYQKCKNISYLDCIQFMDTVSRNYSENHFDSVLFTGISKCCTQNNQQHYYTMYSTSDWNTLPPTIEPKNVPKQPSSYSLWQKQYNIIDDILLSIRTDELTKTKEEKEKEEQNEKKEEIVIKTEKKNIDITINSIRDILNILQKYEYKPEIEYNIDLKCLHNIKDELVELDNMIGMETLKQSILDQLLYFIQELNIGKNISEYKHTVIYGSPGTGKTEVAKIIGKIYSKIGVLKKNIFKKVTRNDLIAGYLGQTAIKTRGVIDECMGGVLFIDEAYSLASKQQNDSFSKECIDTLCEALSDHKNELMVIIAGYEDELNETFFSSNRGLESRFIWRFKMDKYTPDEMMQIFKKMLTDQEWSMETDNTLTVNWFENKKDQFKSFGRDMEILLSYTKIVHGRRIYGKPKELRKIINLEDMNKAYDMFLKNKNVQAKETSSALTSMYI